MANPTAFVRGVLQMRDRYTKEWWRWRFRMEQIAGKRCKESFIYFLNGDCSDELLQSKLKGASEADVTADIDKVVCFFSLSFR